MARSFGRILSSLWADESWCALSPGAQRLHMLLVSQRGMSLAAALDVTPKRWARYSADTTVRDIDEWLEELAAQDWVVLDEDTDELVVPSVLVDDMNPGRMSSKVAKGFWSAWDALDSRHLRRVVIQSVPPEVWEKLESEAPLDAVHFRRSPPIDREPPPPSDRRSHPPTDSDDRRPSGRVNGVPIGSSDSPRTDTTRAGAHARLSTVDGRLSMVDGRSDSPPAVIDADPEGDCEPSPPAEAGDDPARSDARDLCNLLADSIAGRGAKRPNVTDAWVTEMERLVRIDGHSAEDVARVIRWLDTGRDDVAAFWQPNIRSPQKLRSQWDQMREQHHRRNGKTGRAARDDQAWEDGRTILRAVGSDVNPIDLMMRRGQQ